MAKKSKKRKDTTAAERKREERKRTVTVTLPVAYTDKIELLADRYAIAAPDPTNLKRSVVSKLIDDAVTVTPDTRRAFTPYGSVHAAKMAAAIAGKEFDPSIIQYADDKGSTVTVTPNNTAQGPDLSKLQELADSQGMSLQDMLDVLVSDYGRVSYEDRLAAALLAMVEKGVSKQEVLEKMNLLLVDRYGDKYCFSSQSQTDPIKEECRGVQNRVRNKIDYAMRKIKPTT